MKIEIKNEKHTYLYGHPEYFCGLSESLSILFPYLDSQQLKKLKRDLQYESSDFNEPKYLQAVCETSICSSIAKLHPTNFVYENKVNPPKDVDCSFGVENYVFNVEIKCPDFTLDDAIDESESFRLGSFGRFEEFESIFKQLDVIVGSEGKPLFKKLKMDNKLKDYLMSAHEKFKPNTDNNILNVLLICCDTAMDIQDWFFLCTEVKDCLWKIHITHKLTMITLM